MDKIEFNDPDCAEPAPGSIEGQDSHASAVCHHCEQKIYLGWIHEHTDQTECE